MKKSFLLLAALLMMSGAVFAGGGLDFSLGPKVGYQTTKHQIWFRQSFHRWCIWPFYHWSYLRAARGPIF